MKKKQKITTDLKYQIRYIAGVAKCQIIERRGLICKVEILDGNGSPKFSVGQIVNMPMKFLHKTPHRVKKHGKKNKKTASI